MISIGKSISLVDIGGCGWGEERSNPDSLLLSFFLQALSLALFGRQGSSTVYCVFTIRGEVNRQLHVCWPTWPFGCFG